ncbi:hypothetical protein ED733_000079 [Metarhizium rileyi]|uniref:Uncharacterized protein n=1 Tax=Metarhizium rileyi (strain RCEF 4871) TaxID=1649241 RepID=A0A5C6G6K5_METRR|nr:hypothetical protein ED733_000079 [Metarhizium rileyi]
MGSKGAQTIGSRAIREAFPVAVTDFTTSWAGVAGSMPQSSNTGKFEALQSLGPKVIPFAVLKLAAKFLQVLLYCHSYALDNTTLQVSIFSPAWVSEELAL